MESQKPLGEKFGYLDIASIDNKNNKISEVKFIATSDAPSRASRKVKFGDTLFSMVRPYLRNIAFVEKEYSKCIASTGFYICSPNETLYSKFLFYLMLSEYVVEGVNKYMKGDNSPSINNENITNFLYPLPPLAEQKRIIEKIEELLALVDDLETNKTDLQSYIKQAKSKVLDMAVRGELVPQNPDDEPASVLLERIKKEQKSSKSKGKTTVHNTHYEEESSMINKKVPNGWEICFLRDISSNISSKPYQILQSEVKIRSDIPVVSQSSNYIEGYSDQKNKLFVVDNFVIIFGDHTRNIKYIDFDFIVGADGVKIIKPYKYVTKYIYYLLVNVSEKIENRGYSRHFQFLEKYPLNFPPFEEQHRIVEKIEGIFSALEFIEETLI